MRRLIAVAALVIVLVIPAASQDAPLPLDPSNLTATLAARLPLLSAPASTSAHLSPSGALMLHTRGFDFCVYAMPDTQRDCVDVRDQWGDNAPRPDYETFRWSPDERYVAFTEPAFVFFRDSDIWVFDVKMSQLMNVTNDGYDGSLAVTGDDDAPDTAFVDLAPAWHPDGRLTFTRYNIQMEGAPQLMALTMPNGDPEPVAELPIIPGGRGFVMDMDWAPDGSFMAYAMDLLDNPLSGVWGYFVEEDKARLLATPNQQRMSYVSVSVSPDSQSILALTPLRDRFGAGQTGPIEDNGYAIINVGRTTRQSLAQGRLVFSAGWLPDGGLLIVESRQDEEGGTDLIALTDPDADGVVLLGSEIIEDGGTRFFAPTGRQIKPLTVGINGLVVLATFGEETLVVQLKPGGE